MRPYEKPMLHVSIMEQDDPPEDHAWWVDLSAAATASAFGALWPRPTAAGTERAGRIISAFRLLPGGDGEPATQAIDKRRLSIVEDITLLASGLETLTDWKLREWDIAEGRVTRPDRLRDFQNIARAYVARNPHMDADAAREASKSMIAQRRTNLVWALATLLYARDRVQHGKALVHAYAPQPHFAHSKLLRGMILLPPTYEARLMHLPNVPDAAADDHLQGFLQRVRRGFQGMRQEITTDQLLSELNGIANNGFAFTRALLTSRATLAAGYLLGKDPSGALWRQLAAPLVDGREDLLYME